jgi:hypothetical protein
MTVDQSEPERDSAEGRRSPADAESAYDAASSQAEPAVALPKAVTRALPYVAYVAAAVVLLGNLWRSPGSRMLLDNYQDQVWFEWLLTNGANALAHGENPLFTMKLNAPYGLNLMANTSVLALAIPFAPVTWLFGADVTFVLIETLALAGTASAWYFVLNKLLKHRVAATIGGAFCGFAPAMISQATGHPNLAGQYLLPFVLLAVLRLGLPGRRPVVRGLILAGLVVVQSFINEELLFLLAMALAVFLLAYGVARPREITARLPDALWSLGTAVLVAGAVLAYPLYHQFFGRGHYRGLPDYILLYGSDVASYWSFARRSIAGDPEIASRLGQNATEENSFFGWPLLLAILVVVIWLRRDAIVRALAVTGLVFAVLSWGSEPKVGGQPVDLPAPWGWLDTLPLFDSVVPTRLALVVTPVVGCLLAIAVARYADTVRASAAASAARAAESTDPSGPAPGAEARLVRMMGILVLAIVLVPLTPTPLPAFERPYVPPFFTTDMYREYVPRNGVVMGVPPGWSPSLHAMQWQTAAGLDFRIFGGYYLTPDPNDPKKTAMFGPVYPATATMLAEIAEHNAVVEVTPEVRAQAAADFRAIGVTTLVLPAHHWKAAELRTVVDQLAGPGTLAGGMWVWDVRPLTASA